MIETPAIDCARGRRNKEIAQRDKAAISEIMHSKNGRYFISRLFDFIGMHDCYCGDIGSMAFNNGRRSVGETVYSLINAMGRDGMTLRHAAEREYADFNSYLDSLEKEEYDG